MNEEKQSASEKLKLVKVETKGVLGEYDHEIEFSNSESFVIVYGPNGVGKTKFLEIIYAASNVDLESLVDLPFREVKLIYSDGTIFSVAKSMFALGMSGKSNLKITLFDGVTGKTKSQELEYNIAALEEEYPYLERIAPNVWQDIHDGEICTTDDLINIDAKTARIKPSLVKEFLEFKSRVSAFLIEAQRLQSDPLRSSVDEPHPSDRRLKRRRFSRKDQSKITYLSKRMKVLISDAETQHSRITQQRDKTFPNRFLTQTANEKRNVDVDNIKKRYNDLDETRKRLANIVSLGVEDNDLLLFEGKSYQNFQLQLLDLYLDDMKEKYAPFVPLLKKINILENIINSRLLNKTIQITGSDGIVVTNNKTGSKINLEDLSSGEKHEIILMYDLLFSVSEGSVVLIDEPEISLHIAWQFKFIPDVKEIAQVADFRFIIATHSPQIINDDRDSAVSLGPEDAQF